MSTYTLPIDLMTRQYHSVRPNCERIIANKKTQKPTVRSFGDVIHILKGEGNTSFGMGYMCGDDPVLPIDFLAKGDDGKFYVPPYDIQKYDGLIRFSPNNTTGKDVKEWGIEWGEFIKDVKRTLKQGGRTRRRR